MQGARHRLTSAALRQGLAGAAGGFLVFLLLEPGYRAAGWDERDVFGGFAGGFLFSLAQMTSGSGSVSRFAGFVALGACVGVATALVEQFSTFAWLTFLSGSREGREVLIHNDAVVLGRDELADVPL